MRSIILLVLAVSITSCNTSIGMYRDAKQGITWTQQKFQGTASNAGTSDPYGAPTY